MLIEQGSDLVCGLEFDHERLRRARHKLTFYRFIDDEWFLGQCCRSGEEKEHAGDFHEWTPLNDLKASRRRAGILEFVCASVYPVLTIAPVVQGKFGRLCCCCVVRSVHLRTALSISGQMWRLKLLNLAVFAGE
jgi:hypothetical protein